MDWVGVKIRALVKLQLRPAEGGKKRIEPGEVFELEQSDLDAGVNPDHWFRAGLVELVDAPETDTEPKAKGKPRTAKAKADATLEDSALAEDEPPFVDLAIELDGPDEVSDG